MSGEYDGSELVDDEFAGSEPVEDEYSGSDVVAEPDAVPSVTGPVVLDIPRENLAPSGPQPIPDLSEEAQQDLIRPMTSDKYGSFRIEPLVPDTDALENRELEEDERAKAFFRVGFQPDPGESGAYSVAKEFGIDLDTVKRNWPEIERTVAEAKFDPRRWRHENYHLWQAMQKDPKAAPVIMRSEQVKKYLVDQDASGQLPWYAFPPAEDPNSLFSEPMDPKKADKITGVETVTETKAYADKSGMGFGTGVLDVAGTIWKQKAIAWRSMQQMALDLVDESSPEAQANRENILRLQQEIGLPGYYGSSSGQAGAYILEAVGSGSESWASMLGGIGAGALTKSPRVGMAVAKGLTAVTMLPATIGASYLQFSEARTDEGERVPRGIAAAAAVLEGIAETVVEMATVAPQMKLMGWGDAKLMGWGDALAKGSGREWMSKALADSTKRGIFASFAVDLAKNAAIEGAEEGTQSYLQSFGDWASRSFTALGLQSFDWSEAGSQARESAAMGATGAIFGPGSINGIVSTHQALGQYQLRLQAARDVKALIGIVGSDVATQAPQSLVGIVIDATKRTGKQADHVYHDPAAWVREAKANGADPAQLATELMGEEGPARLQRALDEREDTPGGRNTLETTTAENIGWGKKPVLEVLLQDATAQRGGLTVREMESRAKEVADLAALMVKDDGPLPTASEEGFIDAMQAKLMATGKVTKEQAKQTISLLRAHVRTMTERSPEAAKAIFDKMSMDIRNAGAQMSEQLAKVQEIHGGLDDAGKVAERYIDRNTGALNADGAALLDADPSRPMVARIGLPEKKFVNDVHGHKSVNGLLKVAAQSIADPRLRKVGGSFEIDVASQQEANEIANKMSLAVDPSGRFRFSSAAVERGATYADTGKALGSEVEKVEAALVASGAIAAERGGVPPAYASDLEGLKNLSGGWEKSYAGDAPKFGLITPAHVEAAAKMGPADLFRSTYFTEEGTFNALGWHRAVEALRPAYVAAMDGRKIGQMNTDLGRRNTDLVLSLLREAFSDLAVEFTIGHMSGDEFMAAHDDKARLEKALKNVKKFTDSLIVTGYNPDTGRYFVQNGLHWAYGINTDEHLADSVDLTEAKRKQGDPRPADTYATWDEARRRARELVEEGGDRRSIDLQEVGKIDLARRALNFSQRRLVSLLGQADQATLADTGTQQNTAAGLKVANSFVRLKSQDDAYDRSISLLNDDYPYTGEDQAFKEWKAGKRSKPPPMPSGSLPDAVNGLLDLTGENRIRCPRDAFRRLMSSHDGTRAEKAAFAVGVMQATEGLENMRLPDDINEQLMLERASREQGLLEDDYVRERDAMGESEGTLDDSFNVDEFEQPVYRLAKSVYLPKNWSYGDPWEIDAETGQYIDSRAEGLQVLSDSVQAAKGVMGIDIDGDYSDKTIVIQIDYNGSLSDGASEYMALGQEQVTGIAIVETSKLREYITANTGDTDNIEEWIDEHEEEIAGWISSNASPAPMKFVNTLALVDFLPKYMTYADGREKRRLLTRISNGDEPGTYRVRQRTLKDGEKEPESYVTFDDDVKIDESDKAGLTPDAEELYQPTEGTLDDSFNVDEFGQPAAQGSPHRGIRESGGFSLDKIGTGEGAQVYGWGIYFSGRKDENGRWPIAEWYREKLAGDRPTFTAKDGTDLPRDKTLRTYFEPGTIVPSFGGQDMVVSFHEQTDSTNWAVNVYSVDKDGIRIPGVEGRERWHSTEPGSRELKHVLTRKGYSPKEGQLYVAEIPEDDELLDYDKPLSEQPDSVFKKLEDNLIVMNGDHVLIFLQNEEENGANTKDIGSYDMISGRVLYQELSNTNGGDKQASELLNDVGIPGLRYLDNTSRGAGEGSHNYVIWDEARMPIVDELYQPQTTQTESPEFKAWFGKSKVVDENGKPKIVLHGSDNEFDTFIPTRRGKRSKYGSVFFTDDEDIVEEYGDVTYSVYLKMEKPLDLTEYGIDSSGVVALGEAIGIDLSDQIDEEDADSTLLFDYIYRKSVVSAIKEAGYDGVIFTDFNTPNQYGEEYTSYVVFDPTQIKSATGNRGTFDPNNPSILESDKRGFVRILTDASKKAFSIFLTPHADLSTPLHELGHTFFEMFADIAEHPLATERVRTDFSSMLGELRISKRSELTTDHKELLARWFEAYLREGKAPSVGLAGAFWSFKKWLERIYKTLAGLKVPPLSDELRGLFDRMLATDDEINRAKRAVGWSEDIPASPEEIGLPPERWDAYLKKRLEFETKATATIYRQFAEAQARAAKAWASDEFKAYVKAESADWDDRPDVLAWRYVRFGEQNGKKDKTVGKLDLAKVREILGDNSELEKKLKGRVLEIGGENPGIVAEMFGFTTSRGLLEAMAALPEKDAYVREQAKAKMLRDNPEIEGEIRGLKEAAAKAVANDQSGELIELEAGLTRDSVEAQAAKRAARDTAQARTLGRIDIGHARNQAAAESSKMASAAARGMLDEARLHNMRRLYLNALERELMKASDTRDEIVDLANKMSTNKVLGKIGKASHAHRDVVITLLEQLGFEEPDDATGRKGLADLQAAMEADGYPIAFDENVIGRILLDREGRPYRELTTYEGEEVVRALKNIMKAASARNTILVDAKRYDWEEARTHLTVEAEKALPDLGDKPSPAAQSVVQKLGSAFSKFDATLLRQVLMLEWLGGSNVKSWWYRSTVKRLRDADGVRSDLVEKTLKPIMETMAKIPASTRAKWHDKIDGRALFPNHRPDLVPARFFEVIMMAWNAGTQSSLDRLTNGRGISEAEVAKVLEMLDRPTLEYVQSIWDASESLWVLSADLEERETGVRPKPLERRSFVVQTADGPVKMRGGYAPAIYDRDISGAGSMQADDVISGLMPGGGRPTTSQSHLKKRVDNFSDALTLDPRGIQSGLMRAIHDIAFREPIRDVAKIVLDPKIKDVMRHRIGVERYDTMVQWLRDIGGLEAARLDPHAPWFESTVMKAKSAMSTAVLGLGVDNFLADAISIAATPFVSDVTAGSLMSGLTFATTSPKKARKFALESSAVVRRRSNELEADFAKRTKAVGESQSAPLRAERFLRDNAFWVALQVDKITTTAIWTAAYRQAAGKGEAHTDAVVFADDVVSRSMPASGVVDTAAIQRSRGLLGALTVFYGYYSLLYNQERNLAHRAYVAGKQGRGKSEYFRVVGSHLALVIVSQMIGTALIGKGPEPEDGEDQYERWFNWAIRRAALAHLDPLPLGLGRTVEQAWLGRAGATSARPLPFNQAAELAWRSYKAGAKLVAGEGTGDDWTTLVENAVKAIGFARGIPAIRPVRTAKYLYELADPFDLVEEPQQPRGVLDVIHGIEYGKGDTQAESLLQTVQGGPP